MSENGMVRLGYISDDREFPVAPHDSDTYLLYLGVDYRHPVTRVASIGRLTTKPMPDGTIGFGMFGYHKPSQVAASLLSAVGTCELPEPPVVVYLRGKFYLMEKSTALELSGVLNSVV